jgi:ornithine cyclodeaminase
MRVIGHADVARVLSGREADIMSLVRDAYVCHDQGKSALPHSTFLRFNAGASDRIIALPGYLGGTAPAAGVKWIASFPGNLGAGLPRASGVVILNSVRTGQPTAVLEASLISAKRTAASAALAAVALRPAAEPPRLAMIGCGVIAREVLGFLAASSPPVAARLYDTDRGRAAALARYGAGLLPGAGFLIADNARAAVADCDLVCFATTAATPHFDAAACAPGTLVLHLSLRDITPASILACHNVVDDPDHACRENTSVHLAEQQAGNRDFIDVSIGRLLADPSAFSPAEGKTVVYSPFGLGILDLALAQLVARSADADGLGVPLDDFAPRYEGASNVR